MTGSSIFSVNFKNLKSSAVLNYIISCDPDQTSRFCGISTLYYHVVFGCSLLQPTPCNSNPSITRTSRLITRSNFHFRSDHFAYNFILDNSNFFLFPLKVQIIGSRLYFLSKAWHDWRRLTS